MDPRLEPDQLGAALEKQVLTETVAPVHLEREPAEIAQLLLPEPQERATLAAQLACGRGVPPPRASPTSAQEALPGRKAHHPRECTNRFGKLFRAFGAGGAGRRTPARADEEHDEQEDADSAGDEHDREEEPEDGADDDQGDGGSEHGPIVPA